ncbi:MAG: ribonuclease P protein component [Candidatus Riflebacteria bacterium]|nr:ribonuclease P protein component [Candidatus Riflebacteria bacterium]
MKCKADFDKVFASRIRVFRGAVGFYFRIADSSAFRYGLITPKKLGGAVERNRFRRRMRELVRNYPWNMAGFEMVICPTRPYSGFSFSELHEALNSAISWLRMNRLDNPQ